MKTYTKEEVSKAVSVAMFEVTNGLTKGFPISKFPVIYDNVLKDYNSTSIEETLEYFDKLMIIAKSKNGES